MAGKTAYSAKGFPVAPAAVSDEPIEPKVEAGEFESTPTVSISPVFTHAGL